MDRSNVQSLNLSAARECISGQSRSPHRNETLILRDDNSAQHPIPERSSPTNIAQALDQSFVGIHQRENPSFMYPRPMCPSNVVSAIVESEVKSDPEVVEMKKKREIQRYRHLIQQEDMLHEIKMVQLKVLEEISVQEAHQLLKENECKHKLRIAELNAQLTKYN